VTIGNRQQAVGNSKKLKVIAYSLGAMLLALCSSVDAQQPGKIPRLGFLVPGSSTTFSARIEALRQGLRDLGYAEGKAIAIEYRYAEGKLERLPNLASELLRLKLDLIVAAGSEATAAAKNATKEIPIVMTNGGDVVRLGFVKSLARPGGNLTGIISNPSELLGKRLELLKEAVPKASRVAILFNPETRVDPANKEAQATAQALGLKLQILEVEIAEELDNAFRVATRERADALMVRSGAFVNFHQKRIAELAIKNRLPALYNNVDAGFLMSYDANRLDSFRRAAIYIDKILKGAKPGDLPVERPTKFELVINLKAAKQIGLTIPPSVLARADRVIK
jgi:putative tryptophan/tyrosine transport system substrate-binding protein